MSLLSLRLKSFFKSLAVLITALITFETAAIPMAQATMLTPPVNMGAARENAVSHNASLGSNRKLMREQSEFRVPAAIGSIVEIHAPARSGRLIYHLQDIHNNVAAQANLAEIVSSLEEFAAKQNKNLVIAVEGVTGRVATETITRIDDQKAKEDVCAALLRAGYMLGEEYAALTHPTGRIQLVGIENKAFYLRNVQARSRSSLARSKVLAVLHETRKQLEKLVPHNFNALLTTLERKRLASQNGTLPLGEYAAFLKGINPSLVQRYPNVARMAALSTQEAGIDFDKVEKEGKLLVEELTASLSPKEVEQVMADAQALKEGRLSPLSYYSLLMGRSQHDYPSLRQYTAYLRASDTIDADALFEELSVVETAVAKDLIRHPLASHLYSNLRWIEQQERFFSLNMIPQEWAQQKKESVRSIASRHVEIKQFVAEQVPDLGYQFMTPSFNERALVSAFDGAQGFYTAAESRDVAMITNLNRLIVDTDPSKSVVAFIAGGFHTPGMTKLLRDQGFAYEVIRPQLESDVEMSDALHFADRKVSNLRQPEATSVAPNPIENLIESQGNNPQALKEIQEKLNEDNGGDAPNNGGSVLPKTPKRDGIGNFRLLIALTGVTFVAMLATGFFTFEKDAMLRGAVVLAMGVITGLIIGALNRKATRMHQSILSAIADVIREPGQREAKETARIASSMSRNSRSKDSGIDILMASKERNLRDMVQDAVKELNRREGANYELKDLHDTALLKRAIDAYNAKIGGMASIVQGRSFQDIEPTPDIISAQASRETIAEYMAGVLRGNYAYMESAGGRGTRMNLPKEFDRLGIAGLTPAILKRLKEKGLDNPEATVNPEDFADLIKRAAAGIVETADDVSFIQRHLLQLIAQIEIFKDVIDASSAKEYLEQLKFVVTVNNSNRVAIQKQLAAIQFPGSIYIIDQPEVGGLTTPDANGQTQWSDAAVYPEGHGEPFIAMVRRSEGSYELYHDGKMGQLVRPLQKILLETGVTRLIFNQSNDLHLLNDSASVERIEAAELRLKTGAEMVMEFVANRKDPKTGQFQKGGGAVKRAENDDVVMRDTLAKEVREFESFKYPANLSRMTYILDLEALGRLNWDSLPFYLSYRSDSKLITGEYVSGDASSGLNARIIQQEGFQLNTFKSRTSIDLALQAIDRQNVIPQFQALSASIVSRNSNTHDQAFSPAVPVTLSIFGFAIGDYLKWIPQDIPLFSAGNSAWSIFYLISMGAVLFAGLGFALVARSGPNVPVGATLESLKTNPEFEHDQAAIKMIEGFVTTNSDKITHVIVQPGILEKVNTDIKTLFIGTGLIQSPMLIPLVLGHVKAHLSPLQFKATNLLAVIVNELIAYPLGLVFTINYMIFGLPLRSNQNGMDASYEGLQVSQQLPAVANPVNVFYSEARTVIATNPKGHGQAHVVLDISGLSAGELTRSVAFLDRLSTNVGADTDRQTGVVVVNSNPDQIDEEKAVFSRLSLLSGKLNLAVTALGFEEMQGKGALINGKMDVKRILDIAQHDNVVMDGANANVFVLGTKPQLITKVKSVRLSNNFLHIGLALYAHARYANADEALARFVQLCLDILKINIIQEMVDEEKVAELARKMA